MLSLTKVWGSMMIKGSLIRDERGVAAIWFVIMALVVIFPITFFFLNVSNTHEHRRHLQVQVDNGALAAGSSFSGCYQQPADANKKVAAQGLAFAGDPQFASDYAKLFPAGPPPRSGSFNPQVQDPTRVRLHLNAGNPATDATDPRSSTGYANSLSDVFDPTGLVDFSLGQPCDTKFLDVKGTDVGVPAPFGGLIPTGSTNVKARARIEIKKVQILSGFLPWAVPENNPNTVAAIFVNEDNGNVLSAIPLNKPAGATNLNGESLNDWVGDSIAQPVQFHTGMVVLISRRTYTLADLGGKDLVTLCSLPEATCFAGNTQTSGIDFIHGYPQLKDQGDGTTTTLGTVTLTAPGCSPPQESAPYFLIRGGCTVSMRAKLDFGLPASPPANCVAIPPATSCVMSFDPSSYNVQVYDGACSGKGKKMEKINNLWDNTNDSFTIADSSGRHAFCISYQYDWTYCSQLNNQRDGCQGGKTIRKTESGSFPNVQHVYAANTDPTQSGSFTNKNVIEPVDYVLLSSGGRTGNSLNTTVSNDVHIEVGVQPPLHVAPPPPAAQTEPPILLRLAGKGSLTQALQCDVAPATLETMVRDGCQQQYQVNLRDGVCTPPWDVNNLPWDPTKNYSSFSPFPPDCIQAKTGQVAAMAKGLHDRFEAPFSPDKCSRNNWVAERSKGELPDPNDPRWVSLVVTDFGAFNDQGVKVVPINKFGGFYVTGWFVSGSGPGTQGCTSQNDLPPPPLCPSWPTNGGSAGCNPSDQSVQGDVWGYFVTNVILGAGGTSKDNCVFTDVGLCAAVLTQ